MQTSSIIRPTYQTPPTPSVPSSGTAVRRASFDDIELIKKAQDASDHEHEPSSDMELYEALSTGRLQVYILSRGGVPQTVVGCAVEGHEALLCMFYRESHPHAIFYDCEKLWYSVRHQLRGQGVDKVALYVSMKNPRYKGLLKLYERLGFKQDMTRMKRDI